MARLMARGQTTQARQTVARCQRTASLILFPILAWLWAVGPELGAVLFHEPTVGRFMLPMAVGVALNSHQSILCCVLNGMARQKTTALIHLVSDAIQLLFTAVTVKTYGLGGYIFGYLISSVLALLLCHREVSRSLGKGSLRPFSALACAPAAILLGLCTHTLFHVLLDWGVSLFPAVALCLGFGLVFYLTALFACGLLPRQKIRGRN